MPLTLTSVTKRYGEKTVLLGVTHSFRERGVCAISGPSGCGKTTLLRLILGLERPDGGEVLRPEGARFSAVFQEDRLIPHMTARENVALVCGRDTPRARVDAHLEAVGLDPLSRTRAERLSGGMRRRAAIARAVVVRPDILILDEPFNGLDDDIKLRTAAYIRGRMEGRLVLIVTHDRGEAALMGCDDEMRLSGG